MPLTVFDCKGICAARRARIEAAVRPPGSASRSRMKAGLPRTLSGAAPGF
jgi:hypothetical protein